MARRALLVGNWTFTKDPEGLPPLAGPPLDLFRLWLALTDGSSGLFEPRNIVTILDEDRATVVSAIGKFFKEATGADELLFFYAGHGFLDLYSHFWLSARDTRVDEPEASAIDEEHLRRLGRDSAARSVVFILDCCHSGR